LNTTYLHQHYEDINHENNLQMSHILCFIETIIHYASIDVHKFINSSKYSYIAIHDGHELTMIHDIHMVHEKNEKIQIQAIRCQHFWSNYLGEKCNIYMHIFKMKMRLIINFFFHVNYIHSILMFVSNIKIPHAHC